jgi:hypothetical protein
MAMLKVLLNPVLRSRVRCFFNSWIRDPDPGWEKIRDEHPESYFRGFETWIRYFPDLRSGDGKIRIRDKE